jgi:hypothetical protein
MSYWRALPVLAFCAQIVLSSELLACTDELDEVVGYTVIASTQVDGEFEGCDFDKTIRLNNGARFRCAEYKYSYAYMPAVIVFAKQMTLRGKSFVDVKLLIDDEFYEMYPVATRR